MFGFINHNKVRLSNTENQKEKEAEIIVKEQMIFEHQKLEKEICSIQEQLKELPEGKLFCRRNGTHIKWYQSDGHIQTYIPKKKRKFAQQLARRRYLATLLEDDIHEKSAIEMYLRHHHEKNSEEMLQKTSPFHELLSPIFQSASQELQDWVNSPYEKSEEHPEHLIFETGFGICVRSKSEAMIAMMLRENKIPFRYECALELSGIKIFPDFTIRHPRTGEYFYWEHLGLSDDPDYQRQTLWKLSLYMKNNFRFSGNLIFTSETARFPLRPMDVEKTIVHHFL